MDDKEVTGKCVYCGDEHEVVKYRGGTLMACPKVPDNWFMPRLTLKENMSKQVLIKARLRTVVSDDQCYVEVASSFLKDPLVFWVHKDQIHVRKPNQSKALRDEIEKLKEDNERLRKQKQYWKDRCENAENNLLALRPECETNVNGVFYEGKRLSPSETVAKKKLYQALIKPKDGRRYYSSSEFFETLEQAQAECEAPGEVVRLLQHSRVDL